MTAHRPKPTITPERIEWFARYLRREPAWGVFHVWLDDGNYDLPFTLYDADGQAPDVIEAGEWFAKLTASQRKRLGHKADRRAIEIAKENAAADKKRAKREANAKHDESLKWWVPT